MAKTSRAEIVAVARDLMRDKGYAGASMQDIASAVGLLKGSLYSHFPNKEAFVPEVLALAFSDTFGVVTPTGDWRKDYELALGRMVDMLTVNKRCIGLHLVYGIDESASVLREAVETFFENIQALLSTLLEQGIDKELAARLSVDTITELEGATLWLMLGKAEPMQQAKRRLQARADGYTQDRPDAHVQRVLEQTVGDWRQASVIERSLAERVALAEADALNVIAALEGASCFR